MTGANRFRQEWPSLLEELKETDQISEDDKEMFSHLNIVGMVGSIDNGKANFVQILPYINTIYFREF